MQDDSWHGTITQEGQETCHKLDTAHDCDQETTFDFFAKHQPPHQNQPAKPS